MKPGRELDALVAEKVMGWTWPDHLCPVCGWTLVVLLSKGCVSGNCSRRPVPEVRADTVPSYSTYIADAWRVIENMVSKGYEPIITYIPMMWQVNLSKCANAGGMIVPVGKVSVEMSRSMPHAICLAALKAVGAE